MRTLNYQDLGNTWQVYHQEARRQVEAYRQTTNEPKNIIRDAITTLSLAHLMAAQQSKEFKGKVILDLGCGSNNSPDGNTTYQPRLCRVLAYLGAIPIGVDRAPSNEPSFLFVQADLTTPESLQPILDGIQVDLVHSRGLYDSPILERTDKERTLRRNIERQLERKITQETPYLWATNGDVGQERRTTR